MIEVELPDGRILEIEAGDDRAAARAAKAFLDKERGVAAPRAGGAGLIGFTPSSFMSLPEVEPPPQRPAPDLPLPPQPDPMARQIEEYQGPRVEQTPLSLRGTRINEGISRLGFVPDRGHELLTETARPLQMDSPESFGGQRITYGEATGLERAGDQLRSGWETFKQGLAATRAKSMMEALALADRADGGASPVEAPLWAELSPEQRQGLRDRTERALGSAIQSFITSRADQQEFLRNPNVQALAEAVDSGRYRDAWRILSSDFGGIVQQASVESLPSQIPGLVGALAGGVVARAPGMLSGQFLGGYAADVGPRFVEALSKRMASEGVDGEDGAAVETWLRGNMGAMREEFQAAQRGGFGPALADTASLGLARGLRPGAGVFRNTMTGLRNMGIEIGTEGFGEGAAGIFAEGKVTPSEVLMEMLGAGPQAVGTTAIATLQEARSMGRTGAQAIEPVPNMTTAGAPSLPPAVEAQPGAQPERGIDRFLGEADFTGLAQPVPGSAGGTGAAAVPPAAPPSGEPPPPPGAADPLGIPPGGAAVPTVTPDNTRPSLEQALNTPAPTPEQQEQQAAQEEAQSEADRAAGVDRIAGSLPPGWTVDDEDQIIQVYDPNGMPVMTLVRPPATEQDFASLMTGIAAQNQEGVADGSYPQPNQAPAPEAPVAPTQAEAQPGAKPLPPLSQWQIDNEANMRDTLDRAPAIAQRIQDLHGQGKVAKEIADLLGWTVADVRTARDILGLQPLGPQTMGLTTTIPQEQAPSAPAAPAPKPKSDADLPKSSPPAAPEPPPAQGVLTPRIEGAAKRLNITLAPGDVAAVQALMAEEGLSVDAALRRMAQEREAAPEQASDTPRGVKNAEELASALNSGFTAVTPGETFYELQSQPPFNGIPEVWYVNYSGPGGTQVLSSGDDLKPWTKQQAIDAAVRNSLGEQSQATNNAPSAPSSDLAVAAQTRWNRAVGNAQRFLAGMGYDGDITRFPPAAAVEEFESITSRIRAPGGELGAATVRKLQEDLNRSLSNLKRHTDTNLTGIEPSETPQAPAPQPEPVAPIQSGAPQGDAGADDRRPLATTRAQAQRLLEEQPFREIRLPNGGHFHFMRAREGIFLEASDGTTTISHADLAGSQISMANLRQTIREALNLLDFGSKPALPTPAPAPPQPEPGAAKASVKALRESIANRTREIARLRTLAAEQAAALPNSELSTLEAITRLEAAQRFDEDQLAALTGEQSAAPQGQAPAPTSDLEARKAAAKAKFAAAIKASSQRLNAGIDPSVLAAGIELGLIYIEEGVVKFRAWARAVLADAVEMGLDPEAVKPTLKPIYLATSAEVADDVADQMDERAAVRAFDLNTLDQAVGEENANQGTGGEAPNGGAPAAQQPGPDPQPGSTQSNPPVVGDGTPSNVGASQPAENDGNDGVPGATPNVGGAGPIVGGGNADNGRPGASGTGASDAGTGTGTGPSPGNGTVGGSAGAVTSPSPAGPMAGDFHIDDPATYLGGGAVARFNRNRLAIETLNTITESDRPATREEQEKLAAYTGWGSFGQDLFKGTWERPDPRPGWEERDRWLRQHLGKDAWQSAQASIVNAHYTDPPIVAAMWDMVRRAGFEGGRVLEPAVGSGNFFSLMPLDLKARSELTGIELDLTTAAIAKLLFPHSNIQQKAYQDSRTPDGFYDVVIGNWPFAGQPVADRRHGKLRPTLHDFFFLKALDQVRAGGLVIGITSNGTMDKDGKRVRAHLARNAELVAAFRLPSGAFEGYAGTAVVTDIVILKKRATPLLETPNEAWVDTDMVPTPAGTDVRLNGYYRDNPDRVFGTVNFGTGTTRGSPGLIVDRPDNLLERLNAAVALVPDDTYERDRKNDGISYITNHTNDREGALVFQGNEPFIVRGEQLAPAEQVSSYAVKNAKETATRVKQMRDLVEMRRAYADLITKERTGEDAQAERTTLRGLFDAFQKAYGPLRASYGMRYLDKIDDPFFPALAALVQKDGTPAAILSRSTIRVKPRLENPSITDAFVLARQQSIRPTLGEISNLTGKPTDEVKAALLKSGAVFEAVSGDIEPADIYLSGNVRMKLRQAEAAVREGQTHLQRNVDALKEVQPRDVPYYDIEVQLGATWVPEDVYEAYVAHMLNRPDTEGVSIRFTLGRWKARLTGLNNLPAARSGFGMDDRRVPFSRLLQAAMSNQTFKVMAMDPVTKTEYVDQDATKTAADRIANIRSTFKEWIWSDVERRVALEQAYNETRNSHATPKYDGSFMSFEGMALTLGRGEFQLRQHQVNAIWRAVVNRKSINAHEVGTGKTFTMGGIAVESRRYGIAKKPLILAHNANSKAVATEIQAMYPAAKVLYIDNLAPADIEVQLRRIANDDWDAVVLPHSQIDRLALSRETLMEIAKEEIAALEEAAMEAAQDDNTSVTIEQMDAIRAGDKKASGRLRSPTAKDLVRARNSVLNKIDALAIRASRDKAVQFENLGIDMILVDEAHEFKKPPIVTGMKMKGLQTATSDMSIALNFLTSYVRRQNNGNNIHTFTGTPITNTLVEIFHQMRYVMLEEMKSAGVDTWDAWFGSFSREVQDVELSAAGEYEPITRLAAFINVPELRRLVGQYLDVVFGEDMPEMQPRQTKGGKTMASSDLSETQRAELENGRTDGATDRPYKKVINVTSEMTDLQVSLFEQFQADARRFRNARGKDRRRLMKEGDPASPVIVEGGANLASFDERMYDRNRLADSPLYGMEGQADLDPRSKVAQVVKNVMEVYRSDPRANQVIFADQGYNTMAERAIPLSDPKRTVKVKTFSAIKDLVERLVAEGIPREQIALVTGGISAEKKFEISQAMNEGRLRVAIGLSGTLGVGVNMQLNLRAMHHMDAPYMPGDLEQRNGRGWRQGNQWNTVLEYRYITDRLDGRRWQILAIKQRFIAAFMRDNNAARVIEGEAAADAPSDFLESFAEAAGDPRALIREQMKRKLEQLQQAERMHGRAIADANSMLREQLSRQKSRSDWLEAATKEGGDLDVITSFIERTKGDGFSATIGGRVVTKRAEAEQALQATGAELRQGDASRPVGQLGGVKVTMSWPKLATAPEIKIVLGREDFEGKSIASIEAQVRNYPSQIPRVRDQKAEADTSIERLREVVAAPFSRKAQLAAAKQALADLEADLAANPVAPPGWLRIGTPRDATVFWRGKPFTVTGHRWTSDGWFVLAEDERGGVVIPYMEATDQQGIPAYEERKFTPPVVVDPNRPGGQSAPPQPPGATDEGEGSLYANPFDPALFMRLFGRPAARAVRAAAAGMRERNVAAVKANWANTRLPPGVVVEQDAQSRDLLPLWSVLQRPTRMFRKWPAVAALVDQGLAAERRMNNWQTRMNGRMELTLRTLEKQKGDRAKVAAALFDADANEIDIARKDVADKHFAAHDLSPAEATAARELNALVRMSARLVDNHRRAMMPKVRKRKAEIWNSMTAIMERAAVKSPEYQKMYARRARLNAKIRNNIGDLTAHAAEIESINAQLRMMRAADPKLQERMAELQTEYDALEARLANTSVQRRVGYFPHKMFGSWRMFKIEGVDEETGEQIRTEITSDQGFYDTDDQAIEAARSYLKANPGAKLRIERKVSLLPSGAGGAVLSDAEYSRVRRGLEEQTGIEGQELNDILSGVVRRRSRRRVFAPGMFRTGAEGFSEDIQRVLRTHISQSVRYVEMDKLKFAYVATTERLGLSPSRAQAIKTEGKAELLRALESWWTDVNGNKQQSEAVVDGLLNKLGLPGSTLAAFAAGTAYMGLRNPILAPLFGGYLGWRMYGAIRKGGDFPTRTLMGDLTSDQAHLKLGMLLNIASSVVNLSQTLINTYPVLGEKWTAIGIQRALPAMLSQARNRDKPGMMSADAILLRRADVMTDISIQADAAPLLAEDAGLVKGIKRASMAPFMAAEHFNRAAAFLGALARAEAKGLSPAAAFQEAQAVLKKTQFHQGIADRPELLRVTVLKLPTQFKNFMIQQIGFAFDLAGDTFKNPAPVARFLLGLFLAAGLIGLLPLALADWMLDYGFGVSPIRWMKDRAIRAEIMGEMSGTMADFLMRGLPTLLQMDLSGRVGMGQGFIPNSPADLMQGPFFGTAARLKQLASDNRQEIVDYLAAISPAANPLRMLEAAANGATIDSAKFWSGDNFQDGKSLVRNPQMRGMPEFNMTNRELITQGLGFRNLRQSLVADDREIARANRKEGRKDANAYLQEMVQAVRNGRDERVEEIRKDAAQNGVRIPPQRVRDALRDARRDRPERDLLNAPRDMRPEMRERLRGIDSREMGPPLAR